MEDFEYILEQFEDYTPDPSSMNQEPRNMAQGGRIGKPGGLVEEGVEFYAKKVKLTPTMKSNIEIFEELKGEGAYDKQEAYVKKRIRDGANVGEGSGGQNKRGTEEILDLVSRREDGPQLVKEYSTNPTKDKLQELRALAKRRKTYENQMFTTKKRYDEFRAKKRAGEIRAQNSPKGLLQKIKRQSERGMFPATTSKEKIWRDIWRATQNKSRDSRFKVISKIPEKVKSVKTGNLYVPWTKSSSYKNVEFLDTETNKKITFNNLEKYMDKNIGKNKYKDAIANYDLKKQLESAPIKYKGKNTSLGQVLRTGLLSEAELKSGMGFSAIEVNHKGKNLDEFWNTEITTRGANRKLVPLQSRYGAMFKKAKTDLEKNKIIKQFTNEVEKLPGGITTVFEETEIGIKPTAGSVLKSANKNVGAKITKLQVKGIVKKLNDAGFKCSLANGVDCDDPRSYAKSIKENMAKASQGDKSAVSNIKKMGKLMNGFKGAAKFTGWGLLGEIGFAAPLAGLDYAKGANTDEIISNATYGLLGKSEDEQLREKYSDYGQAQDLLDTYNKSISQGEALQDQTGYGPIVNQQDLKNTENKLEKQSKEFAEVLPPSMGFKGDFDLNNFFRREEIDNQRIMKQAQEKKQRELDRDILTKSTGLEAVGLADGGLANLMKKYYD